MSIEEILERQRLSVRRKTADKIAEEISMKPENEKRIRAAHPEYSNSSFSQLPDGWTEIIINGIGEFAVLGEGKMQPGEVRFEREAAALKAFIWPYPDMQWTPAKTQSLKEIQHQLHVASQNTCEWCGKPGQATKLGDRVAFILCEEDAASAREKMTAKVEAFDERVKFRGEIGILFQEHANIWLSVGDPNTPILRKALLDIKQIVESRDLIGKVYITKVLESEGQLFISARCDQADPATQFEIQDIIKNAEWQSDQASLAAGKDVDDNT